MNFLNFKDKKQEEHLCLSLRLNPLLFPKKKKKSIWLLIFFKLKTYFVYILMTEKWDIT